MNVACLTFDCYGTLIDWEQGILTALKPLFARQRAHVQPEAMLRSFVQQEATLEAGSWKPYREILCMALEGVAAEFQCALWDSERDQLADSLPAWPPFPDTIAALRSLEKRFRLVIVSNVDDSLFAQTQRRLGVTFHEIITAEQMRSYKPRPAHFHEVLRRLNLPAGRILHVAQSLYHDHVPARRLGFRTAWIRRPSRLPGTGLAPTASVEPDYCFDDLTSLAEWLLQEPS